MGKGGGGLEGFWLQLQPTPSRCRSLAGGGGQGEASPLVELHVPDAAHGLDLGLVGAELVVVSVVTALEQVLVAPVSGVLVANPPGRSRQRMLR